MTESDIRIVNYLDMTLNLNDSSFKPYLKPDGITEYINEESNHPPNRIKGLPASIGKRL